MKQKFIEFINALMEAAPDVANDYLNEDGDVKAYLEALMNDNSDKPVLTENGKVILAYLQENKDIVTWKSKEIADSIGISSRGVAGTMRKLVSDGFVEKLGKDPAVYTLTEKGKNFIIENEEN